MTPRHELWKLADRLQMDLNNAQARLVELRSHLAHLKLPDLEQPQHLCPECKQAGITHDLRTATKLANHRHYSHSIDVDPPGTCPQCGVSTTNGHAADCPTLEADCPTLEAE